MKMYIDTDTENFVPKNFIIFNFYGQHACIVWNENDFICFPYSYKETTDKLKVYKAPAPIKDIRAFNERIFILCYPYGIYKLKENNELAILSTTGIELGSDFCEVFVSYNGILCLKDKKSKNCKKLFSISSVNNLYVLPLNYACTDESLYNTLLFDNYNKNKNLCIIAYDKQLFKMYDQTVQIIYSCDYVIKKINPIDKHGKTIGFVLQTDADYIILCHVMSNNLEYQKICVGVNIDTMCSIMDKSIENMVLLIYSDSLKTYYTQILLGDSIQETKIEYRNYVSFRLFQSKFVIYLNNNKELFQLNIKQLIGTNDQNIIDYVKLEPNMLKGLENIMEIIFDEIAKLKIIKMQMMKKEDELKRINMYVNKRHLKFCSEDFVKRLFNKIFFVSNFKTVLPVNTIIVKMLKDKDKTIFFMKNVEDNDTIIEMPIYFSNLSSKLTTTTDLITYKNNTGIWCLIKNYIKDPLTSRKNNTQLGSDKLNFIKFKLLVLQNLINENQLSMKTLSKIKKEIRQEILEF